MTPPLPLPGEGLNAAVAAELRAERAAKGMTVRELSDLSEVPYATLRRYLAAERYIDLAVLAALSNALEVEPTSLVAQAIERAKRTASAGSSVRGLPRLQAVSTEAEVGLPEAALDPLNGIDQAPGEPEDW